MTTDHRPVSRDEFNRVFGACYPLLDQPIKTMVSVRLRATGEILELESHDYGGGNVQFAVLGCDPDNAPDLTRAGLLTRRFDGDWIYFTFLEPNSPRVIAWGLAINECCKAEGVTEMIPGIEADLVRQ
jgi:hypothetical protein